MRIRPTVSVIGVFLVAFANIGVAADAPVLTSGQGIKWGPPPPVLPPGAKFAVINGDPGKTGNVTVRLRMPPGYTIPPHFHPTDEHVTVLSGDFSIGMGDSIDKTQSLHLSAGGYAVAMAAMHHYAYTTKGATVQVHMQGPFAITYVNPQDDPSKTHSP